MSTINGECVETSTARDSALDGLRALAIARVITWHATGWTWTTWVLSSVPAMFFVTGVLLAKSFTRSSPMVVLWRRTKRLFPSLWLLGLTTLVLSQRFGSQTSELWTFIVPLRQPTSEIAGEWFTSPLWYVRAYFWILIFSPFLFLLTRITRLGISILGISVLFVFSITRFHESSFGWMIGDFVLYSVFASIGMLWTLAGGFKKSMLLLSTLLCIFAFAVWSLSSMPIDPVVNDNHIVHLVVGGFWCNLFLLFPRLLRSVAQTRAATLLNQYSLTVYLWHAPLAWSLWQFSRSIISEVIRALIVLSLTFLLLPIVTFLLGWIEALGQRNLSLPQLATRIVTSIALVMSLLVSSAGSRLDFVGKNVDLPLPPSEAPEVIPVQVSQDVKAFTHSTKNNTSWAVRTQEMKRTLDRQRKLMNLRGVRAVVTTANGMTWYGSSGSVQHFDEPSLVGSITKTFTTSLIMDLVGNDEIQLDEQVGSLGMNFGHPSITVEQLLRHTSGIAKFKHHTGGIPVGTTPAQIVENVGKQPLKFKSGTRIEYSTAGFVILGVLLEQKTGLSFESLLKTKLTNQRSFEISLFTGRYNSAGFSTGGVSMKMGDLAEWAREYFYSRTTTASSWPWNIRETTGTGVHGYCPCINQGFTALGHIGGRTFASADGDGVVVVIDSPDVLVLHNYKKTQQFAQELRLIAGGGVTPLYP